MPKDNKDRYGYRHRSDEAYGLGESAPGTIGDSEGTIHDRATKDNNVIVDGDARNFEKHKRNKQREQSHGSRSQNNTSPNRSSEPSAQSVASVGDTVEVTIDRVSNAGNPIAEYKGKHLHVEGGEPGQTVTVEITNTSKSYLKGRIRERE